MKVVSRMQRIVNGILVAIGSLRVRTPNLWDPEVESMNLYEETCQDVSSCISMRAVLDNPGTIDITRHLSKCVNAEHCEPGGA